MFMDRPTPMSAILRHDLPAGLVVFLVALPLCLGIALASDAPLISGVISGILGGLVVGFLSGSHTSVSGPAAGLAVIVASAIHELGSFEVFLAAVIAAGLLQVGLGLARAGFLASLIPSSVIKGMLAAIGIIVVLKQIPHALGRDDDFEGDESFWFLSGTENTFTDILGAFYTMQPGVVIVTAIGLAVVLAWDHPRMKAMAWTRAVPGPLVAVALGIIINELYLNLAPQLAISAADGHLVHLPVPKPGQTLLDLLPRPDLTALRRADVWIVGFEIAAIASLETLLSLEATDRIDPLRRTSPPNRELLAQGVGNIACGALGGLPMTAVIVRSSANLYAGARTRWSAVIHGVLLIVLVLSVPMLLNRIPLGSLAAVLLVVGYRLARWELFVDMKERGLVQLAPFLTTVVVTVLSDLLLGVGAGLAVGILAVIINDHHTAIVVVNDGETWLLRFTRDVSFLNKHALRQAMEQVPDGVEVLIDGTQAAFIDPDIQDMIERFVASAPHRNIRASLRGMDGKLVHGAAAAH
jgi:MFS superfamily sulfate permease-like transporter